MISIDEFLLSALIIQEEYEKKHELPWCFTHNKYKSEFFKKNPEEIKAFQNCNNQNKTPFPYQKDEVLFWCWETGGVSGGSCWEDSDPQPYDTYAEEPKPTPLDSLLTEVCPDLPLSKFRKIERDLLKQDCFSENEYYGNHTDYSYKYISIRDLYDLIFR